VQPVVSKGIGFRDQYILYQLDLNYLQIFISRDRLDVMTKRISHISKLSWFKIDSYSCIKDWDYATTLWQLNERRSALIETFNCGDSSNDIALSLIEDWLVSSSVKIDIRGKTTKIAEGGISVLGTLERVHLAQVVSPLSVYDASALYRKATLNKFAISSDDLLRQYSGEPKFAYLKINLNATQSLIETELMKWLKVRKRGSSSALTGKGEIEVVCESMLLKIRNLNILAFLDLLIWESLKDEKINRSSLVECLISNSGASTAKDVERLKNLARQAISANFLSALRTL
jgi:hypothetical protein